MVTYEEELLRFDRKHIWHPYTSIEAPLPVYLVEGAEGVYLHLKNGKRLIDGMASWWSVIHGYNHPRLTTALQQQAEKLSHVMFGGLTHQPAVDLARLLIDISPPGLDRIFYCDSGSVAVEVSMKMAMQYSWACGNKDKKYFLTIRSGYHGDTFHAMSVCDPVTGMHQIYKGLLPEYIFAEKPSCRYHDNWNEDDIHSFELQLRIHHRQIHAVILEPIVQGAGGMHFYHPEYLKRVRELCDQYDVLLIADEIATGFGRSGELFACNHASITPDILCLGKALTGGYLSFAAVLTRAEIGRIISSADPGVFMHGPTFMGNPLACRVAFESVSLLLESDWKKNLARIERMLEHGLAPCRTLDGVTDVRTLGGVGVVELEQPVEMERIQKRFVDKGVWVRPFGRLVYVMVPYIINDEELAILTNAICQVVEMEVTQ